MDVQAQAVLPYCLRRRTDDETVAPMVTWSLGMALRCSGYVSRIVGSYDGEKGKKEIAILPL
jgi:hypothetical protein